MRFRPQLIFSYHCRIPKPTRTLAPPPLAAAASTPPPLLLLLGYSSMASASPSEDAQAEAMRGLTASGVQAGVDAAVDALKPLKVEAGAGPGGGDASEKLRQAVASPCKSKR